MHSIPERVTRRDFLVLAGAFAGAQLCPALASGTKVVPQPYFASVNRALDACQRIDPGKFQHESMQIPFELNRAVPWLKGERRRPHVPVAVIAVG